MKTKQQQTLKGLGYGLLGVSILLGSYVAYVFNSYHIYPLEEPLKNLSFEKVSDARELEAHRKKLLREFVIPTTLARRQLWKLLSDIKKHPEKMERWKKKNRRIKASLSLFLKIEQELMVPKQLSKPFKQCLSSAMRSYIAALFLDDYFEAQENGELKEAKKCLTGCVRELGSQKDKTNRARQGFSTSKLPPNAEFPIRAAPSCSIERPPAARSCRAARAKGPNILQGSNGYSRTDPEGLNRESYPRPVTGTQLPAKE